MNFIDENSMSRLNFKNLISKVEVLSPYGKEKINNMKIYLPGEEELLENEFKKMEKISNFILENKNEIFEIESSLHRFKHIKNLILMLSEGTVVDTVDLYELKVQVMQMGFLGKLLEKFKEIFTDFQLENVEDILQILDPNNEKNPTFHIYESYSLILKEIRKQKKDIENKIIIEKNQEKLKYLKEERLLILVDEEKEEFKIRKNIASKIKENYSKLIKNIENIANLDFIIAKVKFANLYSGVMPRVSKDKEIILENAINIEVKEVLEKIGKKYTPISIKLKKGVTLITGANMGGKSVALKTIAENIVLFHMGFFTFTTYASIPLLDFVYFVSDDMQDLSKGLSTFGAEIIKLKEVTEVLSKFSGFIAFDEFARGTNPKEGQKFVRALAKYLNKKSSISILTTHFDGIVEDNMKHYQVIGLKNLDFDSLKNKIASNKNSLELIQECMDFNLEEAKVEEVPKDALNITKLIGLDSEISEIIYNEYREEEDDE